MEVELFQNAAILLFGIRWQGQMAEAINVDERTIRKWMASGRIPDYVGDDVKSLLVARECAIKEHRRKLPRRRRRAAG